jgi:hypothetical protein
MISFLLYIDWSFFSYFNSFVSWNIRFLISKVLSTLFFVMNNMLSYDLVFNL